MKFIERKKLFIRFLKENNAYSFYVKNLKSSKRRLFIIDNLVEKAMTNITCSEILSSFSWRYTNEGFDFWDELNNKWMTLIIYEYEHKI